MPGHEPIAHHYEHFYLNPQFWVAVSFVLFFLFAGKKIWAALTSALDNKADQIRKDLAEAARLRHEAEAMLQEAERQRLEAQQHAEALVRGAAEEARRVREAAEAEAKAVAGRREKMALDRIASAEKAVIAEVRNLAAEVATSAARDVIATAATPDSQAALLDRSIAGIPKALRVA